LRDEVRVNAERLAAEAGLQIEFIRTLKASRKAKRVPSRLAERGDHPGSGLLSSSGAASSSPRGSSASTSSSHASSEMHCELLVVLSKILKVRD